MEKSLTTKAGVLNYLQGAKEIEKDIYTLEQMEVELKKRAEELQQRDEKNYQAELEKRKAEVERCVKELVSAENQEPPKPKLEEKTSIFVMGFVMIKPGIIGAIAGGIIGMIISAIFGFDDAAIFAKIGAIIGLAAVVIFGLAFFISDNKAVPKTNRKLTEEFEEQKREHAERIASCENELAKAEQACNIPFRKVNYYEKPIKNIRQSLEPLYANREKFYSVGVVPPDYRTMDCVYVLDQIFRNDLADTMREAVLLYEERAFRGDVIRGMQNISRQLGNLSSIMSALRTDINMVGHDLALMRDDMTRVYEQNRQFAADAARSNDRLYKETQLHRYAVEALEKSNQKIVDYLEK